MIGASVQGQICVHGPVEEGEGYEVDKKGSREGLYVGKFGENPFFVEGGKCWVEMFEVEGEQLVEEWVDFAEEFEW